MNDLITTLLDCPNLSLRLLDAHTGRTVKTLSAEQLRQLTQLDQPGCSIPECDNTACPNRAETDHL